LYQIDWPDIGLSLPVNLARAKDAAREWAEGQALTEDRKLSVAQRLNSLDNFWWSSSLVHQIDLDGEIPLPEPERTGELPIEPPRSDKPSQSRLSGCEQLFVRHVGDQFQIVGADTGTVFEEFDSAPAASAWIEGWLSAPRRARGRAPR
jgi:hypothetical protein